MMLNPVAGILLTPQTPIREALSRINQGAIGVAFAVDEDGCLVGAVTDGDIRRALLSGATLESAVSSFMSSRPVAAPAGTPSAVLLGLMRVNGVRQVPLVDSERRVVGVELLDALLTAGLPNYAVVMAGGLGTRLKDLTRTTPKPMLPVGGKPLIQMNIERLRDAGLHRILVAVHYQAQQITSFFGDGERFGVEITYLQEETLTGTAGALRLAGSYLEKPFLVVNGDILTGVNFGTLMGYHSDGRYEATIGVYPYRRQIPYGVVNLQGSRVTSIVEKPTEEVLTNGGIYVLDPALLSYLPPEGTCDMPDLLRAAIEDGRRVGAFPICEYWLDIGQPDDYERANADFAVNFARDGIVHAARFTGQLAR